MVDGVESGRKIKEAKYGKAKLFLHHKSQAAKSTGLVGSNLWE